MCGPLNGTSCEGASTVTVTPAIDLVRPYPYFTSSIPASTSLNLLPLNPPLPGVRSGPLSSALAVPQRPAGSPLVDLVLVAGQRSFSASRSKATSQMLPPLCTTGSDPTDQNPGGPVAWAESFQPNMGSKNRHPKLLRDRWGRSAALCMTGGHGKLQNKEDKEMCRKEYSTGMKTGLSGRGRKRSLLPRLA